MARLTGGGNATALALIPAGTEAMRGDEAPVSQTRRVRGCFAPKPLILVPRAPPSAPGSAWIRRR